MPKGQSKARRNEAEDEVLAAAYAYRQSRRWYPNDKEANTNALVRLAVATDTLETAVQPITPHPIEGITDGDQGRATAQS